MANSKTLDSYFSETTLDNNGIAITDINMGLRNLFTYFNEIANDLEQEQIYLVQEFEEHYPDLIALHSCLGSTEYWWWILLLNRLDNPLTDLKANWVYAINSEDDIADFISGSTSTNDAATDTRIGTVVTLN